MLKTDCCLSGTAYTLQDSPARSCTCLGGHLLHTLTAVDRKKTLSFPRLGRAKVSHMLRRTRRYDTDLLLENSSIVPRLVHLQRKLHVTEDIS